MTSSLSVPGAITLSFDAMRFPLIICRAESIL